MNKGFHVHVALVNTSTIVDDLIKDKSNKKINYARHCIQNRVKSCSFFCVLEQKLAREGRIPKETSGNMHRNQI